MSITFRCSCGQLVSVDDDRAGRQARCPACRAFIRVPETPPEPEAVAAAVEPPPRRSSAPETGDRPGFFGLERRLMNTGVVGGLLLMALAVLWFVAGVYVGRFFLYPPVLFTVGLLSLIRGLTSRGGE